MYVRITVNFVDGGDCHMDTNITSIDEASNSIVNELRSTGYYIMTACSGAVIISASKVKLIEVRSLEIENDN